MFNVDYRTETTIEGLNSHYKKTFKPIFITWLVSLMILAIVMLALTIYVVIDYSRVYVSAIDFTNSRGLNGFDELMKQKLIFSITKYASLTVLLSLMFSFSLSAILKGKKAKDFSQLPVWPSFVMFTLALFSLFSIEWEVFKGVFRGYPVEIQQFLLIVSISQIIFSILCWIIVILVAFKMTGIRNAYINVYRYIESQKFLKENPGIQEFMNSLMKSVNPDYTPEEQVVAAEENIEAEGEKQILIREKHFKKLMDMPNEKLFEIAQTLYISGYSTMEKEKLVNLILDIFEKEKAKKTAEVAEKADKNEEKIINEINNKDEIVDFTNEDNKKDNK
ncbi:hypothetical protein [Mycoplasmopsis felifaucium]|uniref:Rho termination factor N-terminal domain-containing protein n=1 Tax=Mycoplasmopsis felifaucium TaxID=35768 RepID=A0ABZ2RWC3_9BACT